MNRFETFQEFLATHGPQIPIPEFLLNLCLAWLTAWVLGQVYIRFASALSNRRQFAANFVMMTLTTMLVISIVKSSLALSLGLVGALSIVRFRAAIKDPEELTYLFLSIALGLGFGANQRMITLIAFAFILVVLMTRKGWFKTQRKDHNFQLTISAKGEAPCELREVIRVLESSCDAVSLKRCDESQQSLEALFSVEYKDYEQLDKSKEALKTLSPDLRVSILEPQGML